MVAQRRIVIGAIGGDRQKEAAIDFGKAVAEAGCILLTGGELRESDEVKDAAMLGAASARTTGSTARLVGIIPSDVTEWDESVEKALFLRTGLKHNFRNVINGLTPDVLVVFGGSRGTLAEAAFALAARKPLFFCHLRSYQVSERLLKNFREYFVNPEGTHGHDIETYLEKPLDVFRGVWNPTPSIVQLKKELADFLIGDSNTTRTASGTVKKCIAAVGDVGLLGKTGFPGLPGDATAKDRFEEIIKRISN
jgi:uncharacterized protein (TIGR00725 family)